MIHTGQHKHKLKDKQTMATHININPDKLVKSFTNSVDDFCANLSALEPFIRSEDLTEEVAEGILLELIYKFYTSYRQLDKHAEFSMDAVDEYLGRLVDHYANQSVFMHCALHMTFRYLRDREIFETAYTYQSGLSDNVMDLDMHLVYSILMIEDRDSINGKQTAHDYMFLHEESWNSKRYLI